jgi:hypothetical protein
MSTDAIGWLIEEHRKYFADTLARCEALASENARAEQQLAEREAALTAREEKLRASASASWPPI